MSVTVTGKTAGLTTGMAKPCLKGDAMWYALQTESGREHIAKKLIDTVLGSGRDTEETDAQCRLIMAEEKRRYQGRWNTGSRPMFPGYLFIITDNIDAVHERLKSVQMLTRILGTGRDFVPLDEKEERFLERISGDDGSVKLSVGFQEGDNIVVTEGSLMGMEYMIKRVDRHKRKGYIEIDFLGEKRLVEIGLEIVRKV